MHPETKLEELGLALPPPPTPAPAANYVTAVQAGNLVFLAGHAPRRPDGTRVAGKVGQDLTTEQAYEVARMVGLNLLATLKATIGDLGRVKRVVKVLGMVNAEPAFTDHPKVINGCSDLFVAVFGEKGRHARSAVGMGSLPFNIPVEIEAIVEVEA